MKVKKKTTNSLGKLCSDLSYANIMIYKYENNKWWGRKNKTANSEDIDNWDKLSRIWCEKRNKIKNRIDEVLSDNFLNKTSASKLENIFQAIPISLMIDMLTIENIKIYDLKNKKNNSEAKKALAKKKALVIQIDRSLEYLIQTGEYNIKAESRTF